MHRLLILCCLILTAVKPVTTQPNRADDHDHRSQASTSSPDEESRGTRDIGEADTSNRMSGGTNARTLTHLDSSGIHSRQDKDGDVVMDQNGGEGRRPSRSVAPAAPPGDNEADMVRQSDHSDRSRDVEMKEIEAGAGVGGPRAPEEDEDAGEEGEGEMGVPDPEEECAGEGEPEAPGAFGDNMVRQLDCNSDHSVRNGDVEMKGVEEGTDESEAGAGEARAAGASAEEDGTDAGKAGALEEDRDDTEESDGENAGENAEDSQDKNVSEEEPEEEGRGTDRGEESNDEELDSAPSPGPKAAIKTRSSERNLAKPVKPVKPPPQTRLQSPNKPNKKRKRNESGGFSRHQTGLERYVLDRMSSKTPFVDAMQDGTETWKMEEDITLDIQTMPPKIYAAADWKLFDAKGTLHLYKPAVHVGGHITRNHHINSAAGRKDPSLFCRHLEGSGSNIC